MLTKYILAVVGVVFLVLALGRIVKDHGRLGPASRTWLIVAVVFAAVSAWLFTGGHG
jgi:hypothetical protein